MSTTRTMSSGSLSPMLTPSSSARENASRTSQRLPPPRQILPGRTRFTCIRSNLQQMVVSIIRPRRSPRDFSYQHQCLRRHLAPVPATCDAQNLAINVSWHKLLVTIENHMDMVWSDTWMLVWRIDESGELGYVKGDETLEAAIVHYQNAGKNLVQFYVVRKEDETNLPKKLYASA